LTSAIAGCANTPSNETEEEFRNPSDDSVNNHPNKPPALFQGQQSEYSLYDLDRASRRGGYPQAEYAERTDFDHPDNRIISITANDTQVTVTISNIKLLRAIDLKLYVRNQKNKFQEVTETIAPEEKSKAKSESAESVPFGTQSIEFDISNISIPTTRGAFVELHAIDSTPNRDSQYVMKRHNFVGIEYDNGVHWANAPSLNSSRYLGTHPRTGISGQDVTKKGTGVYNGSGWETHGTSPGGYINYEDDANERTLFLAVQTSGTKDIFGVSCRISHNPYDDFINGDADYRERHNMVYECSYANSISHLQELAQNTDEAITTIGLQNTYERLEALADLVQMIPYGNIIHDNIPPTVVLYRGKGDCSNKSGLLTGILQNDPWNIQSAYIECFINGNSHMTAGIDTRDVDLSQSEYSFTVAPSEKDYTHGYPDTDYAFLDMTWDSVLGQASKNVNNEFLFDVDDFSNGRYRIADDPPNY
jgi:hypothetical protein